MDGLLMLLLINFIIIIVWNIDKLVEISEIGLINYFKTKPTYNKLKIIKRINKALCELDGLNYRNSEYQYEMYLQDKQVVTMKRILNNYIKIVELTSKRGKL